MSDRGLIGASYRPCAGYPATPPFDPAVAYPEYVWPVDDLSGANDVYDMVRNALYRAGLDARHFGTPAWNPLGEFVRPGSTVLVKPNFVLHQKHKQQNWECVVTHGAIIRAVLDYVLIALKGQGEISIADAPIQSADWNRIVKDSGVSELIDFYARCSVRVELVDLRCAVAEVGRDGYINRTVPAPGDIGGYVGVDLGRKSLLADVAGGSHLFRVTCYDPETMAEHHNADVNEYLIAKRVLEADVIINLPKLKTHHKAGITGALKNLVGINGHKDWLPHHRLGAKAEGGDEYEHRDIGKRLETRLAAAEDRARNVVVKKAHNRVRRLLRFLNALRERDHYREGSWWGNDTLWRTILDLNRIARYADIEGVLQAQPQRTIFTVMDAVVAGEAEGPLEPEPHNLGLVMAGFDSVALDHIAAWLIGFDPGKIPTIANADSIERYPLTNHRRPDARALTLSRAEKVQLRKSCHRLQPSDGWRGHIEL